MVLTLCDLVNSVIRLNSSEPGSPRVYNVDIYTPLIKILTFVSIVSSIFVFENAANTSSVV